MYHQYDVPDQKWFRQKFTGTLGPYCRALMSEPPDYSVCKKDLKLDVDLKRFAFRRIQGSGLATFANLFTGISKRDDVSNNTSGTEEENTHGELEGSKKFVDEVGNVFW